MNEFTKEELQQLIDWCNECAAEHGGQLFPAEVDLRQKILSLIDRYEKPNEIRLPMSPRIGETVCITASSTGWVIK